MKIISKDFNQERLPLHTHKRTRFRLFEEWLLKAHLPGLPLLLKQLVHNQCALGPFPLWCQVGIIKELLDVGIHFS